MPAATKRKEQDERNSRPTNEAAIAEKSETGSGSPTRFRVVAHPETSPCNNSNASEEQVDVELTQSSGPSLPAENEAVDNAALTITAGTTPSAKPRRPLECCPLPAHIHDPHEPAAVRAKATRCPQLATGRRRLPTA